MHPSYSRQGGRLAGQLCTLTEFAAKTDLSPEVDAGKEL